MILILSSTECAREKCPSFFESQGYLDDDLRHRRQINDTISPQINDTISPNINDTISPQIFPGIGTSDFKGLDIGDPAEVRFFAHPAWKGVSECDARIRVPAKVAPCEFSTISTLWGGRLWKRFCKMFSESSTGSWAELQLPCCPCKEGELLHNLPPQTVIYERLSSENSLFLTFALQFRADFAVDFSRFKRSLIWSCATARCTTAPTDPMRTAALHTDLRKNTW